MDDLNAGKEPIFKSIFGASWEHLPPVMRKHYANCPYTDDQAIVEGVLDVRCSGPIKFLAPLFWLMGTVPPQNERKVPVTVSFESNKNNCSFRFNRVFHFKNRKPYKFQSHMVQIKDNEVAEIMRFGFCWRMRYFFEGGVVKLVHRGYALSLFGRFIPLPLTFLIGRGNAVELAIDEEIFDMAVSITHPLWGDIYGYKGRFRVAKQV